MLKEILLQLVKQVLMQEQQYLTYKNKKSQQPLVFAQTNSGHIDYVEIKDFDNRLIRLYFDDPSQKLSYLIDIYWNYTKCREKSKEKSSVYFKNKTRGRVYDSDLYAIENLLEEFEQQQIQLTNHQIPANNELCFQANEQDFYNQLSYKKNPNGKNVKLKIKGYINDQTGNFKQINLLYDVLDTDPVGHIKTMIEKEVKIERNRIKIVQNGAPVSNQTKVSDLLKKNDMEIYLFEQIRQKSKDFRLKIKVHGKQGDVFNLTDIKEDECLKQILDISSKYLLNQQPYQLVYRGQILDLQKRITDYGIGPNQLLQLYPQNEKITVYEDQKDKAIINIKINNIDSFKLPWRQLKEKTVRQFFRDFITGYKNKKKENQNWCLKYEEIVLYPKDKIKEIQEHIKSDITIETLRNQRHFYFSNKMAKSPKLPQKYSKLLKSKDNIRISTQRAQQRVQKLQIYSSQEKKLFKDDQFLAPVILYTASQFHKNINQKLKNTASQFHKNTNQKLKNKEQNNPQITFSYCLTHSLRILPNLVEKIVHRGQKDFCYGRHHLLQQNKLICFSSFVSTSKNVEISKSFLGVSQHQPLQHSKAIGTLFHITCLTGKWVQPFSVFKREQEVLFAPYTYFVVDKIIYHQNIDQIWMTEVPSPSFQQSKVLLWVDDIPNNNTEYIQQIRSKNSEIQILQVTSTRIANLWMQQFNHLLQFLRIELKVISDMNRKQPIFSKVNKETFRFQTRLNPTAGVQLLRDLNNVHGYTTKILIFTSNKQKAIQQIEKQKIRDRNIWQVIVLEDEVIKFGLQFG